MIIIKNIYSYNYIYNHVFKIMIYHANCRHCQNKVNVLSQNLSYMCSENIIEQTNVHKNGQLIKNFKDVYNTEVSYKKKVTEFQVFN